MNEGIFGFVYKYRAQQYKMKELWQKKLFYLKLVMESYKK